MRLTHKHKFAYGWEVLSSDGYTLTFTLKYCPRCNYFKYGLYWKILGLKFFVPIKLKRQPWVEEYERKQWNKLLFNK